MGCFITDYARRDGDIMWDSCRNRVFTSGLLRDIDEPIISCGNAVFVQSSFSGSKITLYDIETGKVKNLAMKGKMCFNVHSYDNYVVFEYSGDKRGIGILCVDNMEVKDIECSSPDIVLGGMWEDYIVLRRGSDIVLYDINKKTEKIIASCYHIFGTPAIGYGSCVWLQLYRGKCCIVLYDIVQDRRLIFTPPGHVNKTCLIKGYMIYQNCENNKCSIYAYDIEKGNLKKCFESRNWIELYIGRDNTLVWTVRKECQGRYLFDMHVYNIYNGKMEKILSDYDNTVIPTVSNELLLWVDGSMKKDSVYLMPIDVR